MKYLSYIVLLLGCLFNTTSFAQLNNCYSSGDPIGVIKGTVKAYYNELTPIPTEQLRVYAYDRDREYYTWVDSWGSADDLICKATVNPDGSYYIRYNRKANAWDKDDRDFGGTGYRPDIFIYVMKYDQDDKTWYPIARSGIHKNHRMSSTLVINPVVYLNASSNSTCFDAVEHGWKFDNMFDYHGIIRFFGEDIISPNPLGSGLCGGMCFSALDKFHRGEPMSTSYDLPDIGSSTTSYITNRQQSSMHGLNVPAKVLRWITRPDEGHPTNPSHSIGYYTKQEISETINRINQGKPSTLVLVRGEGLGQLAAAAESHQVVAYAYEKEKGKTTFKVYDPNWSEEVILLTVYHGIWKDSKIKVFLDHDDTSGGRKERGFFINDYDKAESPESNINTVCGSVRYASAKKALVASASGCYSGVPTGKSSYWYSGEEIILKPGFIAPSGSSLIAYINPCVARFSGSNLIINDEEEGNDIVGTIEDRNTDDESTTLSTNESTMDFNLYPNPTNGQSTLAFNLPIAGEAIASVYNMQGQLVKELRNTFDIGRNEMQLNLSNTLPKGVYFVRLQADGITLSKSLVLEN